MCDPVALGLLTLERDRRARAKCLEEQAAKEAAAKLSPSDTKPAAPEPTSIEAAPA
jgi:hypothetical protein